MRAVSTRFPATKQTRLVRAQIETDLGNLSDRNRLSLIPEGKPPKLGVVGKLLEADRLRRLYERNNLLPCEHPRDRERKKTPKKKGMSEFSFKRTLEKAGGKKGDK